MTTPLALPRSVGAAVLRPDVAAKLDGSFEYSNDIVVPGMLFGATVRSSHPHARVRGVDSSAALARDDVIVVLDSRDVPGATHIGHITSDQPVFATDRVRYEGEPIAFVVATTQEAAWLGADAVRVEYELLPVVDDPERALAGDAPALHPGGNLVRRVHIRRGEVMTAPAVEVHGDWATARQDQVFLAPESAVAIPDPDGGVTIRLATQDLHSDQKQIAAALALPPDLVRLELAGIGGAFGGREDITLQVHLALAALRTGRPVKTTYRRRESFLAHPKRHPARLRYRVGADRDGTLRYVRAHLVLDGGAYASTSAPVAGSAAYFAAGPYRVPAVDITVESVYTNNPVCGAMRGFGAVQACFGIESTLDLVAARLDIDPIELRRRNALRPGDIFPTSGQRVSDSAPVLDLIDACTAIALPPPATCWPGGDGGTTRGEGVRRGVGFALGVKNHLYAEGVPEHAAVVLVADRNGVEIRSSATEVGQGIGSALVQIATDALGGLAVRLGTPRSSLPAAGSSSASRATFVSGGAVLLAAEELRRRLEMRAGGPALPPLADLLGDDVVEVTAEFRAPVTAEPDRHGQGNVHVSWMFVAHRAVVDVDVDLGLVRPVQIATAQDVGLAVNPREVHGQITGATAQGLGLALWEHLDADGGMVRNATLADYLIPTAADVPPIEVTLVEVPDAAGPLGLKGVGEPGVLSSGPAIAAAVRAATGRICPRIPIRPDDLVL